MLQRLVLPALVACALVFTGCPKDGDGTPDAGGDVTNPDASDTGPVDAGDGKCHGSGDCEGNEYCDLASGECRGAKGCTDDLSCEPLEGEEDYCIFDKCYCDTTRNGGTCLPRTGLCETCAANTECGASEWYSNYRAECVNFNGAKVCLPVVEGRCPRGYVASVNLPGYCEPGGGSCEEGGACSTDADCDPTSRRPICGTNGFCVPACTFDYSTGQSSCPGGQVCHVDPRFLQPGNRNFGAGKCGNPCDAATNAYVCPTSPIELSCEPDGDPLLVNVLPKRCRPKLPKCVRNADCPVVPAENSLGWCDPATLECRGGCRDARDCAGGFKCVDNQCTAQTCIELGGANNACSRGEFCCGETGGPTCANGVNDGECYQAPRPLWCGSCNGRVSTPGGPPRPLPSKCVSFTDPNGQAQTLPFHSCTPQSEGGVAAECPRVQGCKPFIYFCATDADCGGAQGSCTDVNVDGVGTFKGCTCQNGACPTAGTCDPNGSGVCLANWCNNFIAECYAP